MVAHSKFAKRMLDRRTAWLFVALFGLIGVIVIFGSSADNSPPTDNGVALSWPNSGTPFSSSSFWNSVVPSNTPTLYPNPNSGNYVNEILNQLCYATSGTTPLPTTPNCTKSNVASLNYTNWSAPLYVVPSTQTNLPVVNYCGIGVTDDNMTDSNWTNSGWSATTTNATHNTGNTSVLKTSEFEGLPGSKYVVSFTISGDPTTNSTLDVTAAGVTVGDYTFNSAVPAQDDFTVSQQITSVNYNDLLTFTPSTDFNGTISAVSVLPVASTAFANAVAGGVPIPSDAHGSGETNTPDTDTDQEIQVYQPSTDKEWEFWRFQKSPSGTWEACVGGVINNVSTSQGIFPSGSGSTASGLPLLGGVVRIEELQAGEIDHVMNLSLQDNLSKTVPPANINGASTGISWPANRTDGGNSSNAGIPEGQRFILNPNLDLNSLGLSPLALTIATAAQKYGFVVDDSSSTVNIRLGDPTTYTAAGLANPYTSGVGIGGIDNGGKGLFGNGASSMANFPWNQLEALPFDYGEPDTTAPTISLSSPTTGSTVSGNVTINTTASDNIGVANVQFKLDGNNLGSLDNTNPFSYTWDSTTVSNGSHTLTAIAKDAAGNSTTATTITVTVDNPIPPNTTISIGPASLTTSTSASFSFAGTDNAHPGGTLTFQCQLDGGGYSSCTSPTTYTSLSVGSHTFQVRAIDEDGSVDASPPSQTWTITPSIPVITGDLDDDGHVTGHDLSIFLSHYGANYAAAEFDGGNTVEGHDLSILLSNYGK